MKKLLAAMMVAVALGAQAAWEKLGTVQVADVTTLVGGVTKLGEFTGNAMLGLMASSSVSEMPCVALFGPGRAGVPFAVTLFWDGEEMACAFLYPIDQTQEAFLKLHPGKVGKDGVIKLEPDDAGDEEDGDDNTRTTTSEERYVLFSKDGKWVAYGDKTGLLAETLGEARIAALPMQDDLVRAFIGASGKAAILKMIEGAASAGDPSVKKIKEVIAGYSSCVVGVGVDDKGFSVRATAKTVKGSKVAACGLKTVGANPLAFADKGAIFASAIAADCGMDYFDLEDILAIFKKHGIRTDYLEIKEENGGVTRFTLDIPGAVAYFKGSTNALSNVDWTKLKDELEKVNGGKNCEFEVENPAMSMSFAIKGYASSAAPGDRLKSVLPEIADKQVFQVQAWSLYALVKAVLPHVMSAMEPKERAMFESMVATLPAEGKGGVASAYWREGETLKFLFRASPDEFKSVSAGFAIFGAYQMKQQQAKEAKKKAKKADRKAKAKARDQEKMKARAAAAKAKKAKKAAKKSESK